MQIVKTLNTDDPMMCIDLPQMIHSLVVGGSLSLEKFSGGNISKIEDCVKEEKMDDGSELSYTDTIVTFADGRKISIFDRDKWSKYDLKCLYEAVKNTIGKNGEDDIDFLDDDALELERICLEWHINWPILKYDTANIIKWVIHKYGVEEIDLTNYNHGIKKVWIDQENDGENVWITTDKNEIHSIFDDDFSYKKTKQLLNDLEHYRLNHPQFERETHSVYLKRS